MKLFKTIALTSLILGLSGCSMSQFTSLDFGFGDGDKSSSEAEICINEQGESYPCESISMNTTAPTTANSKSALFHPSNHFQRLSEYTEQMVYVIFNKMSKQDIKRSIAVPPFISSDNSTSLNVELAELFIADMQNIGLPVAEFVLAYAEPDEENSYLSTIGNIEISEEIGYVLKGTIRPNSKGVMLYAKVIDVETKAVIASTSKLVPNYLLAQN